jgi:hypothetical protein
VGDKQLPGRFFSPNCVSSILYKLFTQWYTTATQGKFHDFVYSPFFKTLVCAARFSGLLHVTPALLPRQQAVNDSRNLRPKPIVPKKILLSQTK